MKFGLLYPDQGNARLDMEGVCLMVNFDMGGDKRCHKPKGWESPPAGFIMHTFHVNRVLLNYT